MEEKLSMRHEMNYIITRKHLACHTSLVWAYSAKAVLPRPPDTVVYLILHNDNLCHYICKEDSVCYVEDRQLRNFTLNRLESTQTYVPPALLVQPPLIQEYLEQQTHIYRQHHCSATNV